jgi:hypothetical protein
LLARAAQPELLGKLLALCDEVGERAGQPVDLGQVRLIACADPALAALDQPDRKLRTVCRLIGDGTWPCRSTASRTFDGRWPSSATSCRPTCHEDADKRSLERVGHQTPEPTAPPPVRERLKRCRTGSPERFTAEGDQY